MLPDHCQATPNHRPETTLLSGDPMRLYGPILAALAAVAMAVAFAPVPADTASASGGRVGPIAGAAQGGVLGRYVLRSVDGVSLPAPILGEDARHKIQVMDGVLVLNSDGTYICQTIVQTSYMGLVQTEADTIRSQYSAIAGSAIAFRIPPKEVDTVATTGAQIMWTHPVRKGLASAKFLYSK
jgi:hypothetical protein